VSIDDDDDDEDSRASRDPSREERVAGRDDARRLGGRVRAPATGNAVDAARVRGALECEACREVEVRGRLAPRQP
jgi:hypothetical protein